MTMFFSEGMQYDLMLQFPCWLMSLVFISYLNTRQLELDLVFKIHEISSDCVPVMLSVCSQKFITLNRFGA